jgi:hypothetical protein
MLKAKMTRADGTCTYVIGLSDADQFPAEVRFADIGIPGAGTILIIRGESEQSMLAELRVAGAPISAEVWFKKI